MKRVVLLFIGLIGFALTPAAHSAPPHWVGTAPACGASCSDCTGNTPVCMDSSRTKSGINATRYKGGFGHDCSSGKKVLCGPKGSPISPHWVGSAPFCNASCADCTGNTPTCMDSAGRQAGISLTAYKKKFGADCGFGNKVLCGPPGAQVAPRWIGTAPACEASAVDCVLQKGANHFLDIADEKSDTTRSNYGNGFGKDCVTGRKVLCVSPRTKNSLQAPGMWVGTAPLCGASPSDCPQGTTYLESASSIAGASYRGFGQPCASGKKVYCGNRSGEPPMSRKGYANLANDPADGCGDGCKFLQYMVAGKQNIDARAICNEHDRCYATFGASKSACDSDFLGALIDACLRYSGFASSNVCASQAASYFAAVAVAGEKQFNKSQRRARKHIESNPDKPGRVYAQVIGGYWGIDRPVFPDSCGRCSQDSDCQDACPRSGTSTPVCKSKYCLCSDLKPPAKPTGFKVLR